MTRKTQEEVARCLVSALSFVCPKIIQSDNGREFDNALVNEMMDEWGIDYRHSLPRKPNVQGLVERSNAFVEAKINKFLGDNPDLNWVTCLPFVQYSINNTVNDSIKVSPAVALFKQPQWPETKFRFIDAINRIPMVSHSISYKSF